MLDFFYILLYFVIMIVYIIKLKICIKILKNRNELMYMFHITKELE
jgi:hypothetical protein